MSKDPVLSKYISACEVIDNFDSQSFLLKYHSYSARITKRVGLLTTNGEMKITIDADLCTGKSNIVRKPATVRIQR